MVELFKYLNCTFYNESQVNVHVVYTVYSVITW